MGWWGGVGGPVVNIVHFRPFGKAQGASGAILIANKHLCIDCRQTPLGGRQIAGESGSKSGRFTAA
jgi:hypothetical protein